MANISLKIAITNASKRNLYWQQLRFSTLFCFTGLLVVIFVILFVLLFLMDESKDSAVLPSRNINCSPVLTTDALLKAAL